jgi:hypothetical protein
MSRALPSLKIVSAGGFILNPTQADEILIIENPTEEDVEDALSFLKNSGEIEVAKELERTEDKSFIRILTTAAPNTGYCSEVVAKNRCFNLNMEVQHNGVEQWLVGCLERSQADQLVEDLKKMGSLQYHRITESSWNDLIQSPM